jgi:hypothetical protein
MEAIIERESREINRARLIAFMSNFDDSFVSGKRTEWPAPESC